MLYKQLFEEYDFIFVREYKVVTQLAFYLGRYKEAIVYLKKTIVGGWTKKSIQKNILPANLIRHADGKEVVGQYDSVRKIGQQRINVDVRTKVRHMFGKDQRKALGALFTFGSKAQDRYAEKRFVPHSEKQLKKRIAISDAHGFAGEKLIGNSMWAAVMLSHHNSISQRYALADTLYPFTRPRLVNAVQMGQMSPYEFALVDDWYVAVKSGRTEKQVGFWMRH